MFLRFFKPKNDFSVNSSAYETKQEKKISTVLVASSYYDIPLKSEDEKKECIKKINARIKRISDKNKPEQVFTSLEAYLIWYQTRHPFGRPDYNCFTMLTVPTEYVEQRKLLDDEGCTQIVKWGSLLTHQIQYSLIFNRQRNFTKPVVMLCNDFYQPLINSLSLQPVNVIQIRKEIGKLYDRSSLVRKNLCQLAQDFELLDIYQYLYLEGAKKENDAIITCSILNVLSASSTFIDRVKIFQNKVSSSLQFYFLSADQNGQKKVLDTTNEYLYPIENMETRASCLKR